MRFYTQRHAYYCGVDLHTKMMYLCIISQDGEIVLHRNLSTDAAAFLAAIAPYRDGLVVGVECIFCWYWLADVCVREGIAFVLGHALYMKGRRSTGARSRTTKWTRTRSRGCCAVGADAPKRFIVPLDNRGPYRG